MVSSRNRSSVGSDAGAVKVSKPPLENWTTKEKLCLASLAMKHNNAWSSVARNMQAFFEKERPEGWSNQKNCAAQFDKLMNEMGVSRRPKRNEPSDGNSSSVIYKNLAQQRMVEIEESVVELRKLWLGIKNDLDAVDNGSISSERSDKLKQDIKPSTTGSKTSAKGNVSMNSESGEKPPTRALTRRESSRLNLEKTLALLCKEASDNKSIHLICKPSQESERELYDKIILKHVDLSIIKRRLGGEVDDPYAVMNDLLLMFQNVTMFYPPDHQLYKNAVDLRDKLVPRWEKALLDRVKMRHQTG